MPPIPPEQSAEHSAPPPRGPHDHDTRPRSQTKQRSAVQQHAQQHAQAASPHQCQGDRGSSGDDDGDARRVLPVYVRYADLVAAGIVANWTTLLRLIDDEGFPPGVLIGPNSRAWCVDEVERWLAERPSARKVMPPSARHPRGRKRADAPDAAVET
jgi:hypothetical protein